MRWLLCFKSDLNSRVANWFKFQITKATSLTKTMHQSKFLESKTKTSFHNHRAKTAVGERTLTQWSNNNFYRTSYNDMTVKVRRPTAQSIFLPASSNYTVIRFPRLARVVWSQATLAMCPGSRLTTSTWASAWRSNRATCSKSQWSIRNRTCSLRLGKCYLNIIWLAVSCTGSMHSWFQRKTSPWRWEAAGTAHALWWTRPPTSSLRTTTARPCETPSSTLRFTITLSGAAVTKCRCLSLGPSSRWRTNQMLVPVATLETDRSGMARPGGRRRTNTRTRSAPLTATTSTNQSLSTRCIWWWRMVVSSANSKSLMSRTNEEWMSL